MFESLFEKNRPQHRYFPVNIAKYLRLPILRKNCERLLFDNFNGSLLHGPKGSESRLYDNTGFRFRISGPVFCFSVGILVLNRVPTCVRKPKSNTFDESIRFLPLVSFGQFGWFQIVLDGFRSFLDRFRSF